MRTSTPLSKLIEGPGANENLNVATLLGVSFLDLLPRMSLPWDVSYTFTKK